MKRGVKIVAMTLAVAATVGSSVAAPSPEDEFSTARAEWESFRLGYEPDYSDGSKYLKPPDDHRFDEPFVVAREGKPAAKIVWARDAWYFRDALKTRVTETAAKELQALVKMLTGVELPLCGSLREGPDLPVIGVGKGVFFPFDQTFRMPAKLHDKRFTKEVIATVNDDLRRLRGTDGYQIRRFGRDLFVFGCCEKGTMNGVYALIENNTDIIFARPNEKFGTVFTPLDGELELVWGDGASEKPVFTMRGFWNRKQPRYRNANFQTTTPSAEWSDEHPYCAGGHNSSQFVPNAAERPDLHGLVGGKRGDYGFMLCFSNPDLKPTFREGVLSHADHRALEWMEGLHIYLDDTKNWCECEGCRRPIRLADGAELAADDPSFQCTQWFDLLNDAARALDGAYPGVKINTLAYFQTLVPPKGEIAPNIVVGYCPYPRGDDLSPIYSERNLPLLRNMQGWFRVLGEDRRRLWLRGYKGLGMKFPRPLAYTCQRDWKVFSKYVCGMEHEAGSTADFDRIERGGKASRAAEIFDYSAIEFWVMSRLMWNPDADVEGLYKKYCARAYREAAQPMEKFFGTIRRDWLRRGIPSSIGEHGVNATKVFVVDSGREDELRGYLEDAIAKARHPVASNLVVRVKGRFEYFISCVKNQKTSELTVPLVNIAGEPNSLDWQGAAVIDELFQPNRVAKGLDWHGAFPAEIKLMHDGKTLYLKATFFEDMEKIVSVSPQEGKEGVGGSRFEVFLADNSSPGTYHHFSVDNDGGYYDGINYDGSWNAKPVRHKVKKDDKGWTVEMSFPLPELGMNLIADNKMRAAFMRVRESFDKVGKPQHEYTGWKYCSFHKLQTFGTLTLQR